MKQGISLPQIPKKLLDTDKELYDYLFGLQQALLSKQTDDYSAVDKLTSSTALFIGEDMRFMKIYKPISASFPWFCLSLSDQNWTTSHYSAEFISTMRTRKVIYDEMGSSPVSSFSGSWSSGVFTLDNNTANVTMLAALAREYLYAGSPATNWRLLNDGTYDYNITAISTSARTITVSTADHTPSGTSISIYKHRVYGSTTSARHFSEAGLGFYQAGGDKISGLRRLDQSQGFQIGANNAGIDGTKTMYGYIVNNADGSNDYTSASNYGVLRSSTSAQGASGRLKAISDGLNGTPRTGTKTEIEAGTLLAYIYVGTYTA
jgi:hypothetical protein